MKLSEILNPDSICTALRSTDKMTVLAELGDILATHENQLKGEMITQVLTERERLATTGVGEGVAIPHAKIDQLESIQIAVGLSKSGVEFDAVDGEPVNVFFALLAPMSSSGDHLRALAQISRLLKNPDVRDKLQACQNADEVLSVVREQED
jgi:PTS system nitrogen regulatory IIA component